tara:strand:+ start:34 stop:426 length:393 start_codon:yes stop_codon:yes gene_type:complete
MKDYISRKKKLREFGILISIVFTLFIGWLFPLITGNLFMKWTFWISIPLLIFGIFKPVFLLFPYIACIKTGDILASISSRIILGSVFFFMLLPIALIMKIFKYDPLRTRKYNLNSYKELNSILSDLKKMF